ncbi:hypothetical protein ACFWGM_29115, partial [Streptomyces roseolus]
MLPVREQFDSAPDGTYGAWLAELGLSQAVEREILAGFEIDVLEIHDPSPALGESEEAWRGRRLALLQTALLEHAAWNLRTVMTFHQKVEEAAAFTEKLPETAAELYVTDATGADLAAADKLPASSIDAEFYELEAGRHVLPERVWSAWQCADHPVRRNSDRKRPYQALDTIPAQTGSRVEGHIRASPPRGHPPCERGAGRSSTPRRHSGGVPPRVGDGGSRRCGGGQRARSGVSPGGDGAAVEAAAVTATEASRASGPTSPRAGASVSGRCLGGTGWLRRVRAAR